MASQPTGQPVPQIRTPEEWTAGVYANGLGVWFSPTDFTLDFIVSLPNEAGPQGPIAPQEVVARVKIPPALVFQVMRNLNEALSRYEAANGPVPDHRGQSIGLPELQPPDLPDDDQGEPDPPGGD